MHAAKPPMRVVPILAVLAVLAWPEVASPEVASAKVVAAAARVEPLFKSATYRSGSGSTLPYRYFAPAAQAGEGARCPLVLFLHGDEAAGTDDAAQILSSEGATIWVEPDHLAKNPTYVLAPQAPRGTDWGREPVYGDTLGMLKEFVTSHPDVDPDRIYLVGFSMGGRGVWTMLLRNPGRFAAAIPISGDADAFLADTQAFAAIRNTPVLPVHSYDDPVSPVRGTLNAVAAMGAGGDTSVGSSTQIWGLGAVVPAHEAWRPAFHHYEVVYNWLFDQSLARTERGTLAPSSLYTVRDIGGGVAQIWDYYLGTIYVIERSDKALVIDSGMGTGNLYEFIRSRVLENKDVPIEIAVTHDHFDHISGLSGFVGVPQLRKVYVHEEDSALVARVLKADAGKIQLVEDGDRISLGGGAAEVIHVPGHTFGSVVYRYENDLYAGDAVGTGDAWLGFTPLSIEEYVGSLRHLLDRVGDQGLAVLGGHTGECRSPLTVEYVRQMLACARGLVDGSLVGTPYRRTVGGRPTLGHAATVGRATLVYDLNNVHATSGALRSLAVGTGGLSPMFRPYGFFYSASVGPDVTSETITPVALARESATVSVNGAPLEKGGSHEASLRPGRNVFSIVVTTADGKQGTYELTVDRAGERRDDRASAASPVLTSSVFDWNGMKAEPTEAGEVRHVFRAPTATLDELECHVTTLRAGVGSHPPHVHPNEEVLIVREGNVEVFYRNAWHPAGPGAVIFLTGTDPHGIRNSGKTPATYHVLAWQSPGMKPPSP
jgi:glyoxylase-like metal-dependent hydrolase (beta-lactamase superfamily II)/poly(3-hydroxybutyrate) depolymerase/quercetin dioxygenase-like cupin family protein